VSPLRADAEANLDRMVEAAEAVFAEAGLDASIELVAQRAGVGLGTVYRRFANKDALIAELVRRLLVELIAVGERHLDDPDGSGLFGYLHEAAALLAARRGSAGRLWTEPTTTGLLTRSQLMQWRLVEAAKDHQQVRDDLTKEDMAVVLWSVCGILTVTQGRPINAWERHLELLIGGLRDRGLDIRTPALTPAQLSSVRSR
jgi:AcrR family transcriptional regulator